MRAEILPEVTNFLDRSHGHFIDGKAVVDEKAERISVVNPANDEVITSIASASSVYITEAVESAYRTFHNDWKDTLPAKRAAILFKLASLLEEHNEELAQLETLQ